MKAEAPRSRADKQLAAIDALLDHALEETFPASDPTAVTIESVTVVSDEAGKPKTSEH